MIDEFLLAIEALVKEIGANVDDSLFLSMEEEVGEVVTTTTTNDVFYQNTI